MVDTAGVAELWRRLHHHPVTLEAVNPALGAAARGRLRLHVARDNRRRTVDNEREQRERVPWPAVELSPDDESVAIVVVNAGTKQLIAQLLVSLHRVLPAEELPPILVVDNASTDGSREMLRAASDAGLIGLLERDDRPYHSVGLNAGLNWLAARQDDPRWRVRYVAVVDSDVIAAKPGGLGLVTFMLAQTGAAVVGPPRASTSPELEVYAHPSCAVLDPLIAWRGSVPVFQEGGEPALAMQVELVRRGHKVLGVPLYQTGAFIHVGRGTVRRIAADEDRTHRHFRVGHGEAHFEWIPDAPIRYQDFCDRLATEFPQMDGVALVTACRGSERWSLD